MSAIFIVRYAGRAVRITNGVPDLVEDGQADQFSSESAAWFAAFKADFNPLHTTVVNLYELQLAECGPCGRPMAGNKNP